LFYPPEHRRLPIFTLLGQSFAALSEKLGWLSMASAKV
jgi:hypothetical protein